MIRPTTDRAREALFSIIDGYLDRANVMDVFCGTGSFGVEAASRGASSVSFIDNSKLSLKITRMNLAVIIDSLHHAGLPPPAVSLSRLDLSRAVLANAELAVPLSQMDIIFLDPPYSTGLAQKTMQQIDLIDNFSKDIMVIAEESCKETPAENLVRLGLSDVRRYGDSSFWFYRYKNE